MGRATVAPGMPSSGDVLELLCVLALLPLVLAVFGIFGDLLETFS